MARKKKIDLPEVDTNNLGRTGEPPEKPKRNRGGCRTNLLFGAIIIGFLMYIGSANSSSKKIEATQTAVALALTNQAQPVSPTTIPTVALLSSATLEASRETQAVAIVPSATGIATSDDLVLTGNAILSTDQAEIASAMVAAIPITTITNTSTLIPATFTDVPTALPLATRTVQSLQRETRLIAALANVRTCPRREDACLLGVQLQPGTSITVTGTEEGDSVSQSTLWYVIEYQGKTAYVHSSLVAAPGVTSLPSAPASNQSANQPVVIIPSNNQSIVPIQAAQQWSCGGDIYNCSDFKDNIAGLDAYFAACPGDPSNLDGHPENGIPCDGSR